MNIYIGYDPKQSIAYEACVNSIFRNTAHPSFFKAYKLDQNDLRNSKIYWREEDDRASTPFSLTRFLVPALNGYKGWAVYCDCDFLWLDDISNLFALKDDTKAVQVVQHDYTPKSASKMDNQINHFYPKKNWSSLMLFNCEHEACRLLTPDLVNSYDPADLHQLAWCYDEEVGSLPIEWNYLSGYYDENIKPSAVHFTDGGPWLEGYENQPYADKWRDYCSQK